MTIRDLVKAQDQAAALLQKVGLGSSDLTKSKEGIQLLEVLISIQKAGRQDDVEQVLSHLMLVKGTRCAKHALQGETNLR